MKTPSTPQEKRAQDEQFVAHCSLAGLQGRLPLGWPTPPGTPPSPKKSYRSGYVYAGWEELGDPPSWDEWSGFDVLLRLVDFSGLRPVLAQLLGWTSGRGWCPFDPVSLFLLLGWQLVNRWSRAETLRKLQQPRFADYARRFGFREGVYPSEGALRHFLTALGSNSETGAMVQVAQGDQSVAVAVQQLNQLLAQAVNLIREAGVVSEAAWEAALVCPDGQLHEAASRLRCQAVGAPCYQPTTAERPRPCPAREKGQRGCDCATQQCAQICKRATPRDPEARFVWYTRRNQDGLEEGEAHYGYRSLPLQLADRAERRFSLTLLSDVRPANQREEVPAAALLLQLGDHYPDLRVDTVAGDAGVGFEVFLRTVYEHLKARRVVDLRGHERDRDKQGWVLRGYDDQGRPVCAYGYTLCANGFNRARRRHKWVCQQACLQGREPQVRLPQVIYPPPECPYQAPQHQHGKVVNVGACFGDGSWRLVRDVVVGSPTWKALYHHGRNAAEGRNATLEDWGLKRMPVYGLPRSKALLFLTDVWGNLTTLARLIREATLASARS